VDAGYLTSGRELEDARPLWPRARSATRRVLLAALTRVPRSRPPGVRIVHYHFVFDDELNTFKQQLEYFASAFEPVSLSEAVTRIERGDVTGNELVITFDDGFRNQATNAAPLVREAGFRACFFLITELIGADRPRVVELCRERLHLPAPVEPMTWAHAAELLHAGHELGSHTRTHRNLAALPADELAAELKDSRERIEQTLQRPVRHVSAPYGNVSSFSPAVSDAARAAGYASCATAQRGINRPGGDIYALRRDHLGASWPVRDVRYFLSL
jgi:peptidoglycan/xylan/chitin deacetylase (PgdA/CDA1 family)